MYHNEFSDEVNPHLNTVKLIVSKVVMFHENTELLPSGDSYGHSLGNIDPTDHITIILFGLPVINQLG